ncbi:MAG: sigma 54-interacting transcriptional regulator [Pseudomonadota bacterium]
MSKTKELGLMQKNYHKETAKIKILIFGHREFSQLMSSVLDGFVDTAEFKIYDVIIGSLQEIQSQIDIFNPDVVISAGSNAAYLTSELTIPVVSLDIDEQDIIEAVTKASKVSTSICYIHYGQQSPLVSLLQSHLNVTINECLYSTPDQAREHFQIVSKQPNVAFVSASLVCGLAAQQGKDAFLLYSQRGCIKAIQKAISISTSERITRVDHALGKWLLQDAKTPIIMFDKNGRSVTLNHAAKRDLGLTDAFDTELRNLFTTENLSQSDGECLINSMDWWFHRDILTVGGEKTFVFQLYPKKGKTEKKYTNQNTAQLIYESDAMLEVLSQVEAYAATPSNTLIVGETGTGKELIARAIHKKCAYNDGNFVALNCSAIPSELFEGELFGHRDGAFTGARRGGKKGLVEAANGGALFLDEISELAMDQQAKLLRFLQEKSFRPIGANKEIPVNLKLIAATNKCLKTLVQRGSFREDLYYRLNVFSVKVPALRERGNDALLIAQNAAHSLLQQFNSPFSAEQVINSVAEPLLNYAWPGNVRELENIIERLLVSLQHSKQFATIPLQLTQIAPELFSNQATLGNSGLLKQVETDLLLETLDRFNGDKKRTAKHLGLSQTTLWRRLKKMNTKKH